MLMEELLLKMFRVFTNAFIGYLQTVASVEWHRKGDYFCSVMPADILPLLLSN